MRLDRLNDMEQYVLDQGTSSLEELCQHFNVSMNTVRRDLADLVNGSDEDALKTSVERLAALRGPGAAQDRRPDPAQAALRVSGILLLEALGAWLVSRYPVPLRFLPCLALLAVGLGGPFLGLLYVAAGMAPSLRSQLIQQAAGEEERAQLLSAASTVDMLVRTLAIPLAASCLPGG